jgi:hypothetical protein
MPHGSSVDRNLSRRAKGLERVPASSTLADLFTPRRVADPLLTMRASLRRWSSEEREDGMAHGGQSRLRRRPVDSFFPPPCCCEAAMLEEGIRDHRHERVAVKTLPGSALEVIETEFLFELLVSLLTNPSRLDGGRQAAQVGRRWEVGEIVLSLSRHPVFADEPGLVPWWMLVTFVPDPLCRSVGDPHPHGCEPRLELSFRAGAPTDVLPSGGDQHVFGRDRWNVRNVLAPATAAPGNQPDHLHICRVHLEVPWDTDGPGEFASRKPLAKRRAHAARRGRD